MRKMFYRIVGNQLKKGLGRLEFAWLKQFSQQGDLPEVVHIVLDQASN